MRVINVARGGIVDEEALAAAIRDGAIAGAALAVFASEPTTESPLFGLESVVVTPHLGASTREAQDKAGDTIADMVQLALAGEFVPFAVNLSAAEAHETLRPFLPLAERLGRLYGSLVGELPAAVEIAVEGDIGAYDTRIVGLSALKGIFGRISDEPVTYVNAPQRARDHGLEVREVSSTSSADFVNLISIVGGGHTVAGTLAGRRAEHRIVGIDGHTFDVPPAAHMLMITNDDRPGRAGGDAPSTGSNVTVMNAAASSTSGTASIDGSFQRRQTASITPATTAVRTTLVSVSAIHDPISETSSSRGVRWSANHCATRSSVRTSAPSSRGPLMARPASTHSPVRTT